MTTHASTPPRLSLGRELLNKVPEVTLYFWLIKIMCTTVGETAADYVNDTLGLGLTNTSYAAGALLAVLLLVQFRLPRYVPVAYWAAVVVISVFGTLITDNLTDQAGVALTLTTPVFAALLIVVFAVWFAQERTLSIHSIVTFKREAFYWLAVLVTFALGTAAGDLIGEKANLGYALSIVVFGVAIGAVAVAYFAFSMDAVLAFWLAYILTRPLGASIGDFLSQSSNGGIGLGATATSYVFVGCIVALVTFLTITKRDRTPPELAAAELGAA